MKEYGEMLELLSKMEGKLPQRPVAYASLEFDSKDRFTAETKGFRDLLLELAPIDNTPASGQKQRSTAHQKAEIDKVSKSKPHDLKATTIEQQTRAEAGLVLAKLGGAIKSETASVGKLIPNRTGLFSRVPKAHAPSSDVSTSAPPLPSAAPTQPSDSSAALASTMSGSKTLAETAADELAQVTKATEIKPQLPQQIAGIPSNGLVLPRLSLTDQVSELDKIIENLTRSGFSGEQVEIVKKELRGLSESSARQNPSDLSSSLERDLFEQRRSKLLLALSLIGEK